MKSSTLAEVIETATDAEALDQLSLELKSKALDAVQEGSNNPKDFHIPYSKAEILTRAAHLFELRKSAQSLLQLLEPSKQDDAFGSAVQLLIISIQTKIDAESAVLEAACHLVESMEAVEIDSTQSIKLFNCRQQLRELLCLRVAAVFEPINEALQTVRTLVEQPALT